MRALPIMIQGTQSDAGKSLAAAALCRIFAEEGWKTAPFKSQNMALNSFITADGKEIGRAQGLQAEAAGIEADTNMNPILIKPSGESSAQIVVHGKPLKTMKAGEYREDYYERVCT
jgi:adenosylcobyric acid synthase